MSNIEKELRKARPSLRSYSPLAYWDVLIMGIFNLLLGSSFLLALDQNRVSAPLLIVNDLLSYRFWGLIFISLGIIKLWSLKTNSWELARKTLFTGVSIKAAWMVALIVRAFVSPGTIFLALLWVTIALLQIGAYIWFMPPESDEKHALIRRERRNG